ncbi:MAG: ATP-dependent Clp protease proteolytic subunit [Tenericutes bacterium]|nr:ATP-dependent Clp protease proteolytic subunit [Mycoplasmatota bacterium]
MVLIPNIIDRNISGDKIYDIYTKLLANRIIFLSGEINSDLANLVVSELLYLDSLSHDDIFIYINSPGGEVTSGLAIYDTMNYVKSNVATVATGLCASMAAIILAAGEKGKRMALPNSEVMIHQVLGGTQGQATDIKIQAERILKMKSKLNGILSKLTGKNIKKIDNDTERDHYLDAKEALSYGIIDKILNQ